MSGPRLVVFDVDGTLCDSQHLIVASMAAAFAAEGLPPPPRGRVLSIVGLSLPVALARLAPDQPVAVQDRLVAAYKGSYSTARISHLPPLYKGMAEVVRTLSERDHVVLGIATGKSRRGLDHLLQGHGLEGVFATRQVADDHPSKPHPAMLFAAISEVGADPARTVMIGDTTYDMEMGRAAGAATLAVTWGYHPAAALEALGPDASTNAPDALLPALDGIWSRI